MNNDTNTFFLPKSNLRKNKKTYLISKLPDNSPLRSELRSSFEDVDKYLKVDRKIIIGSYDIIFRKSTVSVSQARRKFWNHPMEYSRAIFNI